MCVGYARYNLEEKIPHFPTLKDWEDKKSTKFDTCARMCQHLLARDDAPEIKIEAGEVMFPSFLPVQPGETPQRTIKILISQEFPSLGALLRNVSHCLLIAVKPCSIDGLQVLDLYKIKYLYIDGQMSFQKRAKVVAQFCSDPQYRVLIMSSVGSVGLNLTVASVIIFLVCLPLCLSLLGPYYFLGSAMECTG